MVDPLVLDNAALPIYARGIQCAYLLCNVLVFVGAARLATTSWPQPPGKLSLKLEPMTIDQIAWDCVQSLKPVAEENGIELVLDLRPTPTVNADGARLAQVLDNLVGNAIKFTSAGKLIELRLRPTDDAVLIEVADEGSGISAEDQTRLFNRFFRSAHAADQAVAGSGLGLAISKALVEAHGGTIGVESKSGVGSTFWVKLPYAAPLAAAA